MAETWKKLAFEDDVILKTLLDAQSVIISVADNDPAALVVAEQELVGRLTGGNVDGIAIGLADNNIPQVDGTTNVPEDNDYAKWTASGLEGIAYADVLGDLSQQASAAFSWNNQQITEFVIQIVADNAAKTALTAVIGNMVWQTDVAALYFCTEGE